MTYKVKENLAPEQLKAAIDALLPFYGFGSVLEAADGKGGEAHITLYAGKPAEITTNPNGLKLAHIPRPDDFDYEISLGSLDSEGCILGIVGTWPGVAASYMTPSLTVGDFLAASKAFMECIEETR